MAIIDCPECGKGVSDSAHACPHCGFQLNKNRIILTNIAIKARPLIPFALGAIAILLILALSWYVNDNGSRNSNSFNEFGSQEWNNVRDIIHVKVYQWKTVTVSNRLEACSYLIDKYYPSMDQEISAARSLLLLSLIDETIRGLEQKNNRADFEDMSILIVASESISQMKINGF